MLTGLRSWSAAALLSVKPWVSWCLTDSQVQVIRKSSPVKGAGWPQTSLTRQWDLVLRLKPMLFFFEPYPLPLVFNIDAVIPLPPPHTLTRECHCVCSAAGTELLKQSPIWLWPALGTQPRKYGLTTSYPPCLTWHKRVFLLRSSSPCVVVFLQ